MNKKKINQLINQEIRLFQRILDQIAGESESQKDAWRKETVSERKKRISRDIWRICDGEVKYGPFTGLRLNDTRWWGEHDLASQCLGFYEKEILDKISEIGPFDYFIDVGGADGYYAIGMLKSKLAKKTICFESSQIGRSKIKKNWIDNGKPGHLEIFGSATPSSLLDLPDEYWNNTLMLVDIEGSEFEFLQESTLAVIRNCSVIVEIHHWVEKFNEKYAKLLFDLSKNFEINFLSQSDRKDANIPELQSMHDDNRLLLMSEGRPSFMRFLYLTPISRR